VQGVSATPPSAPLCRERIIFADSGSPKKMRATDQFWREADVRVMRLWNGRRPLRFHMPNAVHAINIEEPDEYNRIVGEFLSHVDKRPLAAARSPSHQQVDHRYKALAA
jgi:hypothetical protein